MTLMSSYWSYWRAWLLYAVLVKIVPPSVSQSGVAVFQVARMATVCGVSYNGTTLCVFRGGMPRIYAYALVQTEKVLGIVRENLPWVGPGDGRTLLRSAAHKEMHNSLLNKNCSFCVES